METQIEELLLFLKWREISILDFYNALTDKKPGHSKQYITKAIKKIAEKHNYKLIVKSNGRYRYYIFKPIDLNIPSLVGNFKLIPGKKYELFVSQDNVLTISVCNN